MLRPGDRVYINASGEEAFVIEVHTHDVVVRVRVPGGHDERRYAHESLRFAPATHAPSPLYAH
jgi:hypothetical protein